MANTIFTENFLLQSSIAQNLYHQYAKDLPIIDFHNHLSIEEIAHNKKFDTMTEIWLKGDHYKWRAMRALGVEEKFITGNTTDEEKFRVWATCVPLMVRNPLFHWTHLELKNPFGINEYLNKDSADSIYKRGNEKLSQDNFRTQSLLKNFKVQMACTTDDPCDDLAYHQQLLKEQFSIQILPGFRPDKILNITNKEVFIDYKNKLEEASKIRISDFDTLVEALKQRIDYFENCGCKIADHGLAAMPHTVEWNMTMNNAFKQFLSDKNKDNFEYPENFTGALLVALCKIYYHKNWVQQFHLGPMRNNNSRQYKTLGVDAGFDSIGDQHQAQSIAIMLDTLDSTNELAKTIIYTLNPSYNEVFATMIGNFNDGSIKGKIQFGAAWWFADHIEGMTRQINDLSNMGVLSTFVGMLTDSRSFLSFVRHEYFRRLLCNIFATDIEKGLLPNDEKWIGNIIQDICYHNAKKYFNIQ